MSLQCPHKSKARLPRDSGEGCTDNFPDGLVAPAATGTTPLPAAETPTAAAVLPRAGFVDGQSSAIYVLPVQGIDGCLRCLVRVHFDKTKAFRTSRVPVHN